MNQGLPNRDAPSLLLTSTGTCATQAAIRKGIKGVLTPAPVAEVVDFYYTRAAAAGYSALHARDNCEDTLGGTKGGASYLVYARDLPNGGSSVDLVANGG